jgi:hypothetical protein
VWPASSTVNPLVVEAANQLGKTHLGLESPSSLPA